LFNSACNNDTSTNKNPYEINAGSIEIYADANYALLTNELIKSYENIYDSARITPYYMSEQSAIAAFLKDSVHLLLIGRTLHDHELQKAEAAQGIPARENIIAYEALAVVHAGKSADSIFDLDAFAANRNNDVKNKYTDKKYIFSNTQSGTLTYLFETIGIENPNTENMFAVNSIDDFISYLENDSSAIGFLSFALISDKDDPAARKILEKIKIMQIVHTDTTGTRMITELSQSNIATHAYPLVRPINLVLGNSPERLGTGFVNFMFKSRPGRIFLKSGLVPAQMPERQILIKQE